MFRWLGVLALFLAVMPAEAGADGPLKVGVFAVDASPPVGSPLAYDPTKEVVHPLSCRGVVLIGDGRPIVLCAVDWIGIGNDGQAEFREALAEAAGTDREAGRASTRCTSTTPRTATSRPTGCSPGTGSIARSSTRTSPAA